MKATVAVLAFTAIVPIPAATWAQQIVNAPGQPIEVTESALDLHGPIPRLTFKGSNVSQQPIGAWGFLIKFKDESGKTILRSTHFGAKIIEPSNQGIAPRQVWYEKIELPKTERLANPTAIMRSRWTTSPFKMAARGAGSPPGGFPVQADFA